MEENTTEQVKPKVKRIRSYKPHTIEPTPMQRRVAQQVADVISGKSTARTTKELLVRAGYSPSTATRGIVTTHQQGVQQALAELGLTKELAISALKEDIEAKPQRRAFELSIAGKWLGLEQRQEPTTQTNVIGQAIILIQPQEPKKLEE